MVGTHAGAVYRKKKTAEFSSFTDELTKIAFFDSKKFKEGLWDEGVPLTGATIGAGLGHMSGHTARGAALGYAVGGAASIARSKMKGEKPSLSRKLLAGGALGYGAGGLAHGALEAATHNSKGLGKKLFHSPSTFLHGATEEALPAAGATLGTGIAMGTHKERKPRLAAPSVQGQTK